jgi:hypothetical protein
MVDPTQTALLPVIAATVGNAFTVTTPELELVAVQLLLFVTTA